MQQINVNNGKYTVVFDDETGKLSALRYGEPWRDLTGDNLVYWLAMTVKELREALENGVSELVWWEREHGCCAGKSDEFLTKAEELLKEAK